MLHAADETFDELCFEYGIELDDVVSVLFADAAPKGLPEILLHWPSECVQDV